MRCVAALLLSFALCASLSAQAGQYSPTGSPPEASASPSPQPNPQPLTQSDSSETPGQVSDELLSYADRLDQMSSELKGLFQAAGISLAASDASLFLSADSVSKSIDSIKSCEANIQTAAKQARLRSLENALWRGAALSGIAGLGGCLADAGTARGAAIGAGVGALAGAAWFVVEHLPILGGAR